MPVTATARSAASGPAAFRAKEIALLVAVADEEVRVRSDRPLDRPQRATTIAKALTLTCTARRHGSAAAAAARPAIQLVTVIANEPTLATINQRSRNGRFAAQTPARHRTHNARRSECRRLGNGGARTAPRR